MKSYRVLVAMFLVLAMVVCGPFSSLKGLFSSAIVSAEETAAEEEVVVTVEEEEEVVVTVEDEEEIEEEENEEEIEDEDEEDAKKPWEIAKDALEALKDEVEAQKDELEDVIKGLEEQYESAKEAGDAVLAAQLLADIVARKAEKGAFKTQMEAIKKDMGKATLSMYTPEELNAIAEAAKNLETEYLGLKALPVENILTFGVNVKFDTPPVIKSGRTLIPVRAISEALGATVDWDEIELVVTIKKGDKVITLKLGSTQISVDGAAGEIDVPAQALRGRTVVPLRFVVEALGLNVGWDAATETVEISVS